MSKPIQPTSGEKAPDFSGATDNSGEISLSDFKGKNIVLYFYPKDMTPGCTTEAIEFTAKMADFDKANTVIIGVSKDSAERHKKFREKQSLKIMLLADIEGKALDAYGAWGQKLLYGKTFLGIIRSTFLIDVEGNISRVWPKVRVKGHVDEVLEAAQLLCNKA
jgi:peroxiredoxin Q/BCP